MTPAIARLPVRTVSVAGHRGKLTVPMHIVRIDGKKTHGWQVRYRGATKMFSDLKLGGAAKSLDAARRHLEAIYIGPVTRRLGQRIKGRSQYGSGISLGSYKRLDRGWTEYRLHVLLPRFGKQPDRQSFYVGTSRDFSDDRLLAALERARRARRSAERAYVKARDQRAFDQTPKRIAR